MNRVFFSKENGIFYLLSFLTGISYVMKGSLNDDIISDLAFSNFVAYGPNIIILILIGIKVGRGLHISNLLIPRLSYRTFLITQYLSAILMMFIYLMSQYGLAFLLSNIQLPVVWTFVRLFFITNTSVMICATLIISLMNYGIKRVWVLLLSIALVLFYHYAYLIGYLTEIYPLL